ncbi:hypothetical protein ACHQM5_023428 [Ranunculus cassubicifolius]
MSTIVTDDYYAQEPPSTDSPPPSPPNPSSTDTAKGNEEIAKEIVFWRRKRVSASIMAAATLTWVLLQIYQYNFLTVISWISMAITVLLFVWGNLTRLVGRQSPDVHGLEISEQAAVAAAYTMKGKVEDAVQWFLKVGVQSLWYEFGGVVVGLWVLSWLGKQFDLLTLLYIGVVLGLTTLVVYDKYQDKIDGYLEQVRWERLREKVNRWCKMVDEKVVMKMKKVGAAKEKKGKKAE